MADFEYLDHLDNNDFLELLNYVTNYDVSINEESVNNNHFINKKKKKNY